MVWRNAALAAFGAWFVVAAFAFNPMHLSSYAWTALGLGGARVNWGPLGVG